MDAWKHARLSGTIAPCQEWLECFFLDFLWDLRRLGCNSWRFSISCTHYRLDAWRIVDAWIHAQQPTSVNTNARAPFPWLLDVAGVLRHWHIPCICIDFTKHNKVARGWSCEFPLDVTRLPTHLDSLHAGSHITQSTACIFCASSLCIVEILSDSKAYIHVFFAPRKCTDSAASLLVSLPKLS